MPPKKKQSQPKKNLTQKTKQVPKILPAEPTDPPQPLSLDTYEVDGKVWLLASNNINLSSFIDTLTDGNLPGPSKDVSKIINFLLSNPGVEEGEDDAQWKFNRYLGAGSFGRVGLWAKESPGGEVLDRIAVKEADHQWVNREATKAEPNLPMEVAINRDLNTYDATHVAYLRNYKYGGRACPRGRLYLKHYKYGDLDKLHKAYAIYGHWLPEWFLYEVLRDLCASVIALNKPPPTDTKVALEYPEDKPGDKSIFQAMHQDVKPENVFLDEYTSDMPRPAAVLADFGEADYTHLNDPKNPESFAGGGTPGYKPREELRVMRVLEHIEREKRKGSQTPDVEEERNKLEPIIPGANNVWGIGRVLFELMTHVGGIDFGRWQKADDGYAEGDGLSEGYEKYLARFKMRADPEVWKKILLPAVVEEQLSDTFPYPADLLALVADMLDPDPMERPDIDAIMKRADDGLQRTLATHEPQDEPGKKPKRSTKAASKQKKAKPKLPLLYYTQEQWAKMPAGPIKWKADPDDPDSLAWLKSWAYSLMVSLDPDGPLIKQPPFMKDEERIWIRTSDQQRAMALENPETGKLMRMGGLRLRKFENPAEMERNVRKQGAANAAADKKRKRAADDDATEEPGVKKPAAKKPAAERPAAKKSKAKSTVEDNDAASSEEEAEPPAKKSRTQQRKNKAKSTVEKEDASNGEDEAEPPAKKPRTQQRKSKKEGDRVPETNGKQDAPRAGGRNLRVRKPVKY